MTTMVPPQQLLYSTEYFLDATRTVLGTTAAYAIAGARDKWKHLAPPASDRSMTQIIAQSAQHLGGGVWQVCMGCSPEGDAGQSWGSFRMFREIARLIATQTRCTLSKVLVSVSHSGDKYVQLLMHFKETPPPARVSSAQEMDPSQIRLITIGEAAAEDVVPSQMRLITAREAAAEKKRFTSYISDLIASPARWLSRRRNRAKEKKEAMSYVMSRVRFEWRQTISGGDDISIRESNAILTAREGVEKFVNAISVEPGCAIGDKCGRWMIFHGVRNDIPVLDVLGAECVDDAYFDPLQKALNCCVSQTDRVRIQLKNALVSLGVDE